jgi:hypothetical protein
MTIFDVNKIIRIDLKSCNTQQVFILSQFYNLDFELLVSFKNSYDIIYLQMPNAELIGYGNPGVRVLDQYTPNFTKKVSKRFYSIPPCKIPKITKNDDVLEAYKYYTEKGYNINIPSLDRRIELETNVTKEVVEVQKETKFILELDTILDKINESGVESLSKQEKDFLDKISKSKTR